MIHRIDIGSAWGSEFFGPIFNATSFCWKVLPQRFLSPQGCVWGAHPDRVGQDSPGWVPLVTWSRCVHTVTSPGIVTAPVKSLFGIARHGLDHVPSLCDYSWDQGIQFLTSLRDSQPIKWEIFSAGFEVSQWVNTSVYAALGMNIKPKTKQKHQWVEPLNRLELSWTRDNCSCLQPRAPSSPNRKWGCMTGFGLPWCS